MPYPDFDQLEFSFEGQAHPYFKAGSGPAVIVIHESPGLYPGVAAFGRRLVEAGYTVYMPSLVGTPGRDISVLYGVETLARACVIWWGGGRPPRAGRASADIP